MFAAKHLLFQNQQQEHKKRNEIYWKFTIKVTKQRQWRRIGVFVVNF